MVPIRGLDTMDKLDLEIDDDKDYWDEEEELARLQEMVAERLDQGLEDQEQTRENVNIRETRDLSKKGNKNKRQRRRGRQRDKKKNKGGGGSKNNKKGGGGKNQGGKKKGGKKNNNFIIPNKHGVKIRTFGDIQLFDLASDPSEKVESMLKIL